MERHCWKDRERLLERWKETVGEMEKELEEAGAKLNPPTVNLIKTGISTSGKKLLRQEE